MERFKKDSHLRISVWRQEIRKLNEIESKLNKEIMSLLEIILEELMNYGHIVDEKMSEKAKITAVLWYETFLKNIYYILWEIGR
jgi:hypothetical protein